MEKIIKLYIFGDSIGYGQLVSHHKTWAAKLSEKLTKSIRNNSFVIQNASVNGNTTRQALERMSYDVISHSPDILIIQFGMNDCNYWASDFGSPRVSKKAFSANLIEIIEKAYNCKVRHIFLNTNHPSLKYGIEHIEDLTHIDSNKEYNEVIRLTFNEVGSHFPITLIDIEEEFNKELKSNMKVKLNDFLLEDGIHLSEKGHNLYFKIIEPIMLNQIKRIAN